MKKYDVIIIGAGPGGIFSAYELLKNNENLKIAIFEEGHALEKRKCPIDIILPMILAAHFMNTSAKRKLWS